MSSGIRHVAIILVAGLIGSACFGVIYLLFAQSGVLFSRAEVNLGSSVVRVDSPAPNFEIPAITGGTVELADFEGQPVVLNFWATWCGPCVIEMPMLEQRYNQFSPELNILAVNIGEPIQVVRKFINEQKYTFPILWDNKNAVQDLYLIDAYPTSLFIDKDGIIRAIHIGLLSEGQLDENLSTIGVGK
jgi:peroxiredoxin